MALILHKSTYSCKLPLVNDALRINIIVNTHIALSSYKVMLSLHGVRSKT